MEFLTRQWGEFVFAPPEARRADTVELPAAEAHHLFDVLRARTGDRLRVTDGAGMVLDVEIQADRRLHVLGELEDFGESPVEITLVMAVLKGDLNKEVVDTATQLGVREIRFFAANRSEGKIDDAKLEKLSKVALAAIKQCGRARLPRVERYRDLVSALAAGSSEALKLIAHPLVNPVADPMPRSERVEVYVGPEGGFGDDEVRAAIAAGCLPFDLGERRLRGETAAAAALTTMRERWRR